MLPEPPIQVAGNTWKVVNRNFSSNSYICSTGESGSCFLVDPGTDPEAIAAALSQLGLTPMGIYCTHGHFDHLGGASHFQKLHGVPCYLHGADVKTMRSSNFLMMAFRIPYTMDLPEVEEAKGLSMRVGNQDLTFTAAPGHTPGSCIIQYGEALFTGDTLYSYGVGLSKLPGEDPGLLKTTLLGLWDQLPLAALVCPGHGDCASFERVRRENKPLLNYLGKVPSPMQEI
jgi:glyoxylase-like metal-dependent hydrolase (beta-lactamase superfamily II)